MTTICPKCSYARQATEDAPDWQCPSCGIAYAKFRDAASSLAPAQGSAMQYDASDMPDGGISWSRLVLLAFLLYGGWMLATMERNKVAERTPLVRAAPSGDLRKLAATVKHGDIVMYTTTDCPYCIQAKGWLRENGFVFTECDTQADAACASDFRSLGGVGVPYLIVRGKPMKDGFDSAQFVSLLRK